MHAPSTTEFAAFVGIDWADRKHDMCLMAGGSNTREFSVLVHRPEAIAQWAEGLWTCPASPDTTLSPSESSRTPRD